MSDYDLDTHLAQTLHVVGNTAAYPHPGRGRSIRPGKNALRRMKIGRLVQEYRLEISERKRRDVSDRSWPALADELERRHLPESARQVRDDHHRGDMAITTVMATTAVALLSTKDRFVTEDQQIAELERVIDNHAEELGSSELPVELDRERDVLSEAEYLADLEEVGVNQATIDAEIFASEIAGAEPGLAMTPYSGVETETSAIPESENVVSVEAEL